MDIEIGDSLGAPVPREPWIEEEGSVVVLRDRPTAAGLQGLIARTRWRLEPRRIRLDELGSFVWRRLDGRTSVAEIAAALREASPDDSDDVERRLEQFLATLVEQRLVSVD